MTEEDKNQDIKDENNDKQVNFSLDPNKVLVLHADSYLIFSNQHAVTLNFGQAVLNGQQQNIVSRIALTRDQAKEFLATLNDHIEKFEV